MDKHFIISIDGMAASGKTTLAKKIMQKVDCNVFSMDDFFLPTEIKTKERLREIGGNAHYERFYEEVIKGIISHNNFDYSAYSCKTCTFEKKHVVYKPVSIIEGSYSSHPYFCKFIDKIIFMQTSKEKQIERIVSRGQGNMLNMFLKVYIPLENIFFEQNKTIKKAYKVITT